MISVNINNKVSDKQAGKQAEQSIDLKWEEECYRQGCAYARQQALDKLQTIEENLYARRPCGWKVIGFRERTFVTRFGEVTFSRRLYRDEAGKYHFLLDEYLNLPAYQSATASLTESLLEWASQLGFEQVGEMLEKLTAGVLSVMTIYRALKKVAEEVIEEERQAWQGCYEEGKLGAGGERSVEVLYVEADGVYVHLQREDQSSYELKNAIAYEGWERLEGKEERYRLVGKRVYSHAQSVAKEQGVSFWEGASLEWDRNWDLLQVEKILVGGDGAKWIEKGVEELEGSERQLDGFHLARACRRGWGGEKGAEIYQGIRLGEVSQALEGMKEAKEEDKGEQMDRTWVKQARHYVENHLYDGVDWRYRLGGEEIPEGARGLGTMESQEDKLFANRVKKRGMSWTIQGVERMGKVIQLRANGELGRWCGRYKPSLRPSTEEFGLDWSLFEALNNGEPYRAGVPIFRGPQASRPWVQEVRKLLYSSHLLN
jgi:hypothetical protein